MIEAVHGADADPLRQSYEDTPYRDQPYPLFTLERLLGLAQFFRLREPGGGCRDVRVLDLGCASGRHLRAEAARHPGARFTGVDFSTAEIELGRKAVEEAGFDHVDLVEADLRTWVPEPGAFDVVVCHGVFSWVPDDVKERILMACRAALAPGGIGALAYLTYPGWKQREAIRELLEMRDRRDRPADERIAESARLLRVLQASYAARRGDPHATSMRAVIEDMQQSPSNVFLHDELGGEHDPCYFLQLVEWAGECGLRYLAEADLGTMSTDALAPAEPSLLDALAPDALELQQLVDFAVNRSGRASLFVRDDATPRCRIERSTLEALRYRTRWWNVTPLNAPKTAPFVFESPTGGRFETGDRSTARLIDALASDRAASWTWSTLADAAGAAEEPVDERVARLLMRGLVEPVAATRPATDEGRAPRTP